MRNEVTLKIILENPATGVDYGLQQGKGTEFKTIQIKRGSLESLEFECSVKVKFSDNNSPVFLGSYAQGPAKDRFLYIDIGTFAGQKDSCWDRRLKIPLSGITSQMVQHALSDTGYKIEAVIAGSGKRGGPNCGTVKPFSGWKLKTNKPVGSIMS
jgi:hypothetical protein